MPATILETPMVHPTPAPWLRWGGGATFAVADQAFFAGTNFLVSMLLARWLPPEAYGAFALAYAIFWLLGTLHASVLTSPMLVFGTAKYARHFRRYYGLLLSSHVVFTAVMSAALAGAAALFGWSRVAALSLAFAGLAVATPFILWTWFLRSAYYARFQPQWSAAGGALYLLATLAGLAGLRGTHHLSQASAMVVLGASGLLVGVVLTIPLRPVLWIPPHGLALNRVTWTAMWRWIRAAWNGQETQAGETPDVWDPKRAIADHLRYARWDSASSATGWIASNLQYLVLGSAGSLASVAVMRVLDSLLAPYFHFQAALCRYLIPVLGRRARTLNGGLLPVVIPILVGLMSLAAIAWLLIRIFASTLIPVLYGQVYAPYGHLLVWYALIVIPEAGAGVLLSMLRALVKIELVFSYLAMYAAAMLAGFLLGVRYGLPGVVFARLCVSYTVPLVLILLARAAGAAPSRDAIPSGHSA